MNDLLNGEYKNHAKLLCKKSKLTGDAQLESSVTKTKAKSTHCDNHHWLKKVKLQKEHVGFFLN